CRPALATQSPWAARAWGKEPWPSSNKTTVKKRTNQSIGSLYVNLCSLRTARCMDQPTASAALDHVCDLLERATLRCAQPGAIRVAHLATRQALDITKFSTLRAAALRGVRQL